MQEHENRELREEMRNIEERLEAKWREEKLRLEGELRETQDRLKFMVSHKMKQ